MLPPLLEAPSPAVPQHRPQAGPALPLVPPAPAPAPAPIPPVIGPLPQATLTLLDNALRRYLNPPLSQICYTYRICIVDIDPDTLANRVVLAGGVQKYPCRIVPAVPLGGPYPVGFEEVETVLMQETKEALLSAIIGNFPGNRNRTIREIHGQTSDFAVGASILCSNIQITNQLTFQDWLSRLPSPGNYIPRIQLIRSPIPGGPPNSPPQGPSPHSNIDMQALQNLNAW